MFYVKYDRLKKGRPEIPDSELHAWPWENPAALDKLLGENHFKKGVLPAYRSWSLVKLDVDELFQCAVEITIFNTIAPPGSSRALGSVDREFLKNAAPEGERQWWEPLSAGAEFTHEWALILRRALRNERPAKWYVEDGSGRVLALLRRVLKHNEPWRTAWAYLGVEPDEQAPFMQNPAHRELLQDQGA